MSIRRKTSHSRRTYHRPRRTIALAVVGAFACGGLSGIIYMEAMRSLALLPATIAIGMLALAAKVAATTRV